MAAFENLRLTFEGGMATLTMDRPPLNVINIAMMREINSCIKSLAARTDLKVLVFAAKGKAFSAGVDISEHMGDTAETMLTEFHDIFRNLIDLGCPTVSMVRGGAFGGGCELAVFCDNVLASDKASFGQPEIKVGVYPPVAAALFPGIVGEKKARELVMAGGIIPADEAKRIGLVNEVFPDEAFETRAAKFLTGYTSLSAPILKHARRAVAGPSDEAFLARLKELEKYYLKHLMKTGDAAEGLTAFMEKRSPVWQNR